MTRRWSCVWITGASSGIGYELARRMAARAGYVAVSARNADALEALAGQSESLAAHPLDVTDPAAVKATVKAVEGNGGAIDLAVLNAGAWTLMDSTALNLAAVRQGIEVNQMGVMHALDAVLPGMLERGRGHIVIVASVAGYRGLPRSIAYGPTKAALINVAETLRAELAPHGIRVSVVNPGFVDTPMTRGNPFPMPAIISAEKAGDYMMAGIAKGKYEIAFPRRFVFFMKLLRIVPNRLHFWIMRNVIMRGGGPRADR